MFIFYLGNSYWCNGGLKIWNLKMEKRGECELISLEQFQTQAQNEHLQFVQTEMTPKNLQNLRSQLP